ncbi:SDR family oxidoreductase [Beggiatoa leptomitoformis]|uniref:SDR family oxidoreductase n=1 Tax=Beggiatoa leptomitoformis TaxID=288004 RepID=A0A2N9Y9W0_9GAMM|nr:SDR family oxidoreductase [Beggiatoa leptomitoformis]ALG67319.1 SDR family oxidoreductase [Beggiatoa leptomitoformis]AUI67246.1 SDR family oxidoreductase [Beggiatoa leptomitoformis]
MKRILILGATAMIAQSLAKRFAQRGERLFLVGRDAQKLQVIQQDLKTRGASSSEYLAVDLTDIAQHKSLFATAEKSLQEIDIVIIAYGTLGDQQAAEQDFKVAEKELVTNFLSVASLLTELGNYFEKRKQGSIVVISSVAGDRGRQSNYVYGAAKGALSLFLQGLRNRLFKSGVQVLTVKPGFVDTPMTAGIKKNFLFASPDKVAQDIDNAISKGKKVLYTPWFWQWIMLIIKSIPEAIFVKLKL